MDKLLIIWFFKSENSNNGFDFYFYFLSSLLLALILLNCLFEGDICVNILFDGSNFLLHILSPNRSVITGVRKGGKKTRNPKPQTVGPKMETVLGTNVRTYSKLPNGSLKLLFPSLDDTDLGLFQRWSQSNAISSLLSPHYSILASVSISRDNFIVTALERDL